MCRKQWGTIILTALARTSEQAPFYVFTAFIFAYGVTVLHASRDFLLAGVLAATCLSAITIPLSGYVSDRIGRKKMYIIGAATMGVFGFIYFGMIDTGSSVLIFIAMVLSLIPHDMQYGPQAALIAESFTPRLRYSGASITAGGPAPLIANCKSYAESQLRVRPLTSAQTLSGSYAIEDGMVKVKTPYGENGWSESKDGKTIRHAGILNRLRLSREDCEAIIINARIKAGWISQLSRRRRVRNTRSSLKTEYAQQLALSKVSRL